MTMNSPIILNFDNSVGNINDAILLNLTDWQEVIRFGCSMSRFRMFQNYLEGLLPKSPGTVLMGSGDYHHISLLLIERLKQYYTQQNPIQVVIFDNHPDNMRYLLGIHCGSWVSYVAHLPFVSHVHVVGITSNDIGFFHFWENRLQPLLKKKLTYWSVNMNVSWGRRIGLGDAFRQFNSADELITGFLSSQYHNCLPTYLSIDKDVLSEEVVQTNWDQGCLRAYHLFDAISALHNRIIGSDITGDVSVWKSQQWWKRLLSSWDKQPQISQETLQQWQVKQQKLNTQLVALIRSRAQRF